MNARELLAEVTRHGGRLLAHGGRLHIEAPKALPDDLIGRLRTGKAELLTVLSGGAPDIRLTERWPADLATLLRRVSVAFEWTAADVRDFRQWAQRSPAGLADARTFLQAEAAKLPAPSVDARRRGVLDMLAADPAIRYAYTLADDETDPLRMVIAIRDTGTAELAIPREGFDLLALPALIGRLVGAP
ncbi:MAG: hypothetical protein ACSLFJ_06355 [Immundisolibacter sp.]|uniref:hypothetical protein n=1 Tax=Immundisolibacter sp. TaxID=1934948 RepID=UPI003EDEA087